jgi:hypothetical protein
MAHIRLVLVAGVLAATALAGLVAATPGRSRPATLGTPPPEWRANAESWPSHNFDLANTRADFDTQIAARDVSKLKQRWTFPLAYSGGYGSFTSNPIVLGGVVYL